MMVMEEGLLSMNNSEKIVLVDLDDQITGSETKTRVHEEGLLHRAFSIFILDDTKMLLQRRSIDKYHSGGLWSNACCSHQRENELLDEAVHRRMNEELGFDCSLNEMFSFIYRTVFENGLTEYEYDHVFVGEYSGTISINYEEASEVKWFEFEELKRMMQSNPELFSSWFIIAAPRIIRIIEEK